MPDMPTVQLTTSLAGNPGGWPEEVLALFERAITVEYATLTRAGAPITYPLTPYPGESGLTLDVSTGLTYPAKAERARRNPKVALLFSDPVGSGLDDAPVALVQGLATVRDADLQANTDRYVRLGMVKLPAAYEGQPRFLLRQLAWYFARIWIEVTPTRMLWWPAGRLDERPQEWTAPEGIVVPPSDPAPPGRQPGAWSEQPAEWRKTAEQVVRNFPFCDLTVVGTDGFPECWPAGEVVTAPDGFRIQPSPGVGPVAEGRACLTFHTHNPDFTTQENRVFVGRVSRVDDGALLFGVERLLGDWSLGGSRLSTTLDFLFGRGRRLRSRLRGEADRRGQPVPKVRFPGEY
ncbi:MAG: hemerythrin [Rubrobacter sp.]